MKSIDKKTILHYEPQELFQILNSSDQGLSSVEADKRLGLTGLNELNNRSRNSAPKLFLNQFKSSLIYFLLLACVLSFLLQNKNDGIVIAIILIINTGLGFLQEFKSEKAIEKLEKLIDKEVLVKRDRLESLIGEKFLVPGDVVTLREGDIVPADIRLLSVTDLSVNESQLTGESSPVPKAVSCDNCLVFAGSTIEKGEGEGIVFATGAQTELGKIAHLSSATARVTQYEKSLQSFSGFLIKVTLLTLLAVFLIKLLLVHDVSQIYSLTLFILALSIAVVPEAMPVIATVTLARGALKLAKQHVIAKTLSAVEDLGNITILATDKTGTLTENKQTISKLVSDEAELFQKLAMASLEDISEHPRRHTSSFDEAFLSFVPADIQESARAMVRLKELPFDPEARRRRIVASDEKHTYLIEIGSAETLLKMTDDKNKATYLEDIKYDGENGLRHLGIAYKQISYSDDFDILKHEDELKFLGYVALEDPLHPGALETIKLAEKLDVGIKILSGDSKEVTQYVATKVGLFGDEQVVYTGDQIEKMDDKELAAALTKNNAFARLTPNQKYRIIQILKDQGEVVGYQGDGINDVPALKLADVGIAVNHATDVAKESADVILLHSDLGVIINGIKDGRAIFSNINKYIRYTFVGNWGNFFALGALYLIKATLPILPAQVLLLSLLSDIPCITIATDNVDSKELQRPSKYSVYSIMFISMLLGVVTALFEIMYFALVKDNSLPIEQTALYLFLSLTQLVVIFSIRNKDHFWQAPRLSMAMKVAFSAIIILAVMVIYFGVTEQIFSFIGLSWSLLVITLVMTALFFLAMDTIKVWFYKTKIGSTH